MEQRKRRFQIRLTEKECDSIRVNANRAGISMSEYVRKRLANQNIVVKPAPEWFSVQHKLNGMCETLGLLALAAEDHATLDTAVEARKIAREAYSLVREAVDGHGI